jgi:hypothetical protein
MATKQEYTINCAKPDRAVLSGVLRLPSPESYERVFLPVKTAMRASSTYTIDVSDLAFLNSSGIRALAGIVLDARKAGRGLSLVGRHSVPWQRKTAGSLHVLYAALEVQLN